MSEPFAPLLPALSTFAASIYQKANFEKQGEEAGEHPLGTGAFMLDHWDKGQRGRARRAIRTTGRRASPISTR